MSGGKPAIAEHLGKRELLSYYRDMLLDRAGLLSAYEFDLLPKDKRIVSVCYGNICRSPFAEGMLTLAGYDAISVGLRTQGGRAANEKAVIAAQKYGVDLTGHVSSSIHDLDIGENDCLLFMEYDHLRQYRKNAPQNLNGAVPVLLGVHGDLFSPLIFDPYGRSEQAFQLCFELIVQSLSSLIEDASQASDFASS